jgi:hypothetical protein
MVARSEKHWRTYSELPGGIDPSTSSTSRRILNVRRFDDSILYLCNCVEGLSQSWQKSLSLHLGLSADLLVAGNSIPLLRSESITTSDFVKLNEWCHDGPLEPAIPPHFQMPRDEDLQSHSPAKPCQKREEWELEAKKHHMFRCCQAQQAYR